MLVGLSELFLSYLAFASLRFFSQDSFALLRPCTLDINFLAALIVIPRLVIRSIPGWPVSVLRHSTSGSCFSVGWCQICRNLKKKLPKTNCHITAIIRFEEVSFYCFVLFVIHHKKIAKNFKMVEVLVRPRCAMAMLLVEAPAYLDRLYEKFYFCLIE